MSQSGNIYACQNFIVNVSNRVKPLFLDPYFNIVNTVTHQSFLFVYSRLGVNVRAHLLRKNLCWNYSSFQSGPVLARDKICHNEPYVYYLTKLTRDI